MTEGILNTVTEEAMKRSATRKAIANYVLLDMGYGGGINVLESMSIYGGGRNRESFVSETRLPRKPKQVRSPKGLIPGRVYRQFNRGGERKLFEVVSVGDKFFQVRDNKNENLYEVSLADQGIIPYNNPSDVDTWNTWNDIRTERKRDHKQF